MQMANPIVFKYLTCHLPFVPTVRRYLHWRKDYNSLLYKVKDVEISTLEVTLTSLHNASMCQAIDGVFELP